MIERVEQESESKGMSMMGKNSDRNERMVGEEVMEETQWSSHNIRTCMNIMA